MPIWEPCSLNEIPFHCVRNWESCEGTVKEKWDDFEWIPTTVTSKSLPGVPMSHPIWQRPEAYIPTPWWRTTKECMCIKPWPKSRRKCMGWTETEGLCKETLRSGGDWKIIAKWQWFGIHLETCLTILISILNDCVSLFRKNIFKYIYGPAIAEYLINNPNFLPSFSTVSFLP